MKVLIFFVFVCISSASRPCLQELSVDLTNATYDESKRRYHHNSVNYSDHNVFLADDGSTRGCPCNFLPCIRKCCGENQMIDKNKTCGDSSQERSLESDLVAYGMNTNRRYTFVYGFLDCKKNKKRRFILKPESLEGDKFVVTKRGTLLWSTELRQDNYCLDYYKFGDIIRLVVISCEPEKFSYEMTKNFSGMIISMPFLLATFLVYTLLPDRNLPAKALMCYVLSLLFAYIMLVTIQLNSNLGSNACQVIAFMCYFFFMASFFWMNSSCIDIWLTFSGIKGITGQRTQERKRFVYYCLYSWGLPLVMTVIVVIVTMYPLNSADFDTGIGNGQCWFQNGLPTGIYFYFPVATLLITNITLFIVTALKIRNVQRDTKMLNAKDSSKHEKDKQRYDVYSDRTYLTDAVKNRGIEVYDFLDEDNSCFGFNLYVKLLFAMGINWSMEVISWIVQWKLNNIPSYIWYITDFCNAMYGVLIFFIFVFKRNIWLMLKKRYLQFIGKPTQAHSMGTSTHRTTVSQVTSSEA